MSRNTYPLLLPKIPRDPRPVDPRFLVGSHQATQRRDIISYILEPIDSVEVLTLMDNSTDMTLESNEIAARTMFGAGPVPAAVIEGGMAPNAFLSEHGFSSLVTVHKGDTSTRILFDAGLSPDGLIENMRRLEINPTDIDIIILSHNHWDHITGLSGFVAAIGRVNLPVYIHPVLMKMVSAVRWLTLPSFRRTSTEFDPVNLASPITISNPSVISSIPSKKL